MNNLQAMIEGWSQHWQKERAETQMTLGQLIEELEAEPGEREVIGFGQPHSYRGFYTDLSFEPVESKLTASELLRVAQSCMGRVFEGYKGGDFLMGENTPLWMAEYGSTGPRLMALNTEGECITPVLAEWRP